MVRISLKYAQLLYVMYNHFNEKALFQLIYQLSIQGKGTKVISNYLNDNNIPTKRNNVLNGHLLVKGVRKTEFKWRDSVIYNILTNTIYIGERI